MRSSLTKILRVLTLACWMLAPVSAARAQPAPPSASARRTPCEQLMSLPRDADEPPALLEQARVDSVTRQEPACATVAAARYVNHGQYGVAQELLQYATQRNPGDPLTLCIAAINDLAQVTVRASTDGAGDLMDCGSDLTRAASTVTTRCAMVDGDARVPRIALSALRDVSRYCADRGHLVSGAAVLSRAFGLGSPEVALLRRTPLPLPLSDAITVRTLSQWLQVDWPLTDAVPIYQRRARDLLRRLVAEEELRLGEGERGGPRRPATVDGPLSSRGPTLVAARALLATDARLVGVQSSAYGGQIADLEYLDHHRLLEQGVIAEAAAQMPLLWPAGARMSADDVQRLARLRSQLRRLTSPQMALVRYRLGVSVAVRDVRQSACERARNLAQVQAEFLATDGLRGMHVHRYASEMREASNAGITAARACETASPVLIDEFERVLASLDAELPPVMAHYEYHPEATP